MMRHPGKGRSVASPFAHLSEHRYMLLTSTRKDGSTVAVPVWLVAEADKVYLWTDAGSPKVRRLRNNPACTVAPCNASGRKVLGPPVAGRARVVDATEFARRFADFGSRYGWQLRLIHWMNRTFRGVREMCIIEISAV